MNLKIFLISMGAILSCVFSFAQSPGTINKTKYKIVFQLTNGDTAIHRGTLKQIFNALTAAPNSQIELVCHNNGISILQSSKTILQEQIKTLKNKGVIFAACANTIRDRNIDPTDIVAQAILVQAGVIEIADKQSKGWSYIKAGN